MPLIYLYSLLSVIAVSLISLIGIITLSFRESVIRRYVYVLVSLAVGALLGDAFIHLIPESFENIPNPTAVSLAIILSILIFFILEKFLHWHHHQLTEREISIHPTGRKLMISDAVHNFLDGLIIAGSYLVSVEVGVATTIAVILHEIPQEFGDFGVMIHSGYTINRAIFLNFLSALAAILGTIIALGISGVSEVLTVWLVPFAAGGFIYIAMSDLIPELHKTKNVWHSVFQFVAVL